MKFHPKIIIDKINALPYRPKIEVNDLARQHFDDFPDGDCGCGWPNARPPCGYCTSLTLEHVQWMDEHRNDLSVGYPIVSDEEAILTEIRCNYPDDALHLRYADWLDDHNRPDEAYKIREEVLQL